MSIGRGSMIPCYQLCKDRCCPYWNPELLDCDRLPDGCDFAVEHLVLDDSDRENQFLDGEQYGLWRDYWENGQLMYEGTLINGQSYGLWRVYHANGQLKSEGNYLDGKGVGLWRWWYDNGQLKSEGNYVNGMQEGLWRHWDDNGQLKEGFVYEKGELKQ